MNEAALRAVCLCLELLKLQSVTFFIVFTLFSKVITFNYYRNYGNMDRITDKQSDDDASDYIKT